MTFADFEPVSSNTQDVPSGTQRAPTFEKVDSPTIPLAENQAVECKEDCEIDEPKTTKIVHVHYHYVINVDNKNCDAQSKQDHPMVSDIPLIGISSEPMSLLKEGSVVAISTCIQPGHCLNNMEPSTGGSVANGQWRVKETEQGHFLFCSMKREKNGSLRVGKVGKVSCDGGTGTWAQFKVESLGGSQISIQSVGNEEVYGRKWYLAVDQATGALVGNSTIPFPFYLVACETAPPHSKPKPSPLKQGKPDKKLEQASNQSAATTSERLPEDSDARAALQPGKVVVLCSFEKQQNRKRTDGWHLGVSPTGMLVPDAGQSSWGQWRVELPERKKSTATTTEAVCFASVHTPKWHLRVNGDGRVSPKGGRGSLAQFRPIFHTNNGRVSFQCVAHGEEKPNRDGGNGWCLAVMEDGNIVGNADASQPYAQFLVREVPPTQTFNNAHARAQDQTGQQQDKDQDPANSQGQGPSKSQQQQQQQRQQEGGLHIPLRFAGRCRFGPRRYRLGVRCMDQSAADDTAHSASQASADNREKKQLPRKSADRAAQVASVRMAAFKELLDKAMEKAAFLTTQAKEDPNNNRLQLQAKKMEAKVQKLQQRLEFWNQRLEKCREADAKSDEPSVVSQDSCKDASITSLAEEINSEVPSEAQQLDEVLAKIREALTSTDSQTKQQLLNMLNSLLSSPLSEEQTKKE